MPPAASAETCHPWPNRGRACQRAPPSEADEEDAAGPLKDRFIAELTEHRTKVITSIGGSIARKSALASASRIQKQKSHSLSLVTTSVFPAKTASPRFGIRPAGHGGGPGLPRSPGLQIPLQVLLFPLAMFVLFTTAGIATGYEINFLKGRITVKQRVFVCIWRG
jgi:hypothetical protein